jgi:Ca2+:H+ antiporter
VIRYALLVFIPIALALAWSGANPILTFVASALGIVPLTVWIGDATENLALRLGDTLGGLLNATMGNLPEMIIGVFALRRNLHDVVKASLTGSLLGNVLLILGVSLLAGGLRHRTQKYNRDFTGVQSVLLLLAATGLIVPALHHYTTRIQSRISLVIAGVLFLAYLASLAFTLVTHRQLFMREQAEGPQQTGRVPWGLGRSAATLAATAVGLGFLSEALTGALDPMAKQLALSPTFAGVILLATVGNVSGLINAVQFARRDQMDLTMSVTLGAGTQAALLVAPVLVFASHVMGRPLDLVFTLFEVVAIVIAVIIGRSVTIDGESNWLEGVLLVAVYAMLGVGFYYLGPS